MIDNSLADAERKVQMDKFLPPPWGLLGAAWRGGGGGYLVFEHDLGSYIRTGSAST